MEKEATVTLTTKPKRQYSRGLSPLRWWMLLVCALYVVRLHQRLCERTRLLYAVKVEGRPIYFGVSAILDGKPFSSGSRAPLGQHVFSISYPKADPYITNLFVWYGEHDLGDIDVKRSRGSLAVQADPPALVITIQGPEFTLSLTNSSGTNCLVPTDHYQVR